jgi:hypothetical protein
MSGYFAAYAVYVWLILTTTLAATDFIAVLSYIIQKQPHGMARIMWGIVLIGIGLVAIYYGISSFTFLGWAFLFG